MLKFSRLDDLMTGKTITDYTGFDYKKNFWEKSDRRYEDFCDRLALRKLLPKKGKKFADICGGFGRLAGEYLERYPDVCLFDYAQNLLDLAKTAYGARLRTVQGSVYELPFTDGELDALSMVRAAHHLTDFPAAIAELARVLGAGGRAVIEVANKRNLLEILRWLCGRSKMRPFNLEPTSRNAKGFYNFHPRYVEQIFAKHNLRLKRVLAVSSLRWTPLKKIFDYRLLCALEYVLQDLTGWLKLSPSVYYLLEKKDG